MLLGHPLMTAHIFKNKLKCVCVCVCLLNVSTGDIGNKRYHITAEVWSYTCRPVDSVRSNHNRQPFCSSYHLANSLLWL